MFHHSNNLAVDTRFMDLLKAEKSFIDSESMWKFTNDVLQNGVNPRKRKLENASDRPYKYPNYYYPTDYVPSPTRESLIQLSEWKNSPLVPDSTQLEPNLHHGSTLEHLSYPLSYPYETILPNFSNTGVMQNSSYVHPEEKICICLQCETIFTSSYQLKNHIGRCFNSIDKTLKCAQPEMSMDHSSPSQNHSQSPVAEKIYKCMLCNSTFAFHPELQNHMLLNHAGEIPYPCGQSEPNNTFTTTLENDSQSQLAEKPYKCMLCSSRFTHHSGLENHMRIHTGEAPYTCTECELGFTQSSNLQNHLRLHTGEKPFNCELCDSKFTQLTGLQNHVLLHKGEKPFKCSECDAKFTQLSGLQAHMRRHTGELGFTDSSALKNHLHLLTGEKLHKCPHCDSNFTQLSMLKNHMRLHTGEKLFNCDFCEASFCRSSELKYHVRIHALNINLCM